MHYQELAEYLISFMLGEGESHRRLSRMVGYTADVHEAERYQVVIVPSGFFDLSTYGHPASMPQPPLAEFMGTPLLFGEPHMEQRHPGGPLWVYADLVASSYFMVSRYEEMYRRKERDQHDRFPGKESLPYRAGFLHRPIVDEYGAILKGLLARQGVDLPDEPRGFMRVNFTHDVDVPFEYRGVRGFARAWLKEGLSPCKAHQLAFGSPLKDRYWSFPRFLEWNKEAIEEFPKGKAASILFYKTPTRHRLDAPHYRLRYSSMRQLHQLAKRYQAEEQLHLCMGASGSAEKVRKAKITLERDLRQPVTKVRYHYLAAREPEDILFLQHVGLLDDYTMGYADVAGFRLGTCRPVRSIIPSMGQMTRIILHPLTLMDCTLDRHDYMDLDPVDALEYGRQLIRTTCQFHGELNLLFHNNYLAKEVHPFHSRLYRELLRCAIRAERGEPDTDSHILTDKK